MRLPRYEVEHLAKEGEGCDLDESRADRKEGKFQCAEEFFLFVRHKKHLAFAPYFSTKGGKSQGATIRAIFSPLYTIRQIANALDFHKCILRFLHNLLYHE